MSPEVYRYFPIAIIVAAALFVGAVIEAPDRFVEIQKWQTSIAGICALFAASIVYRAAMIKVEQDAKRRETELLRSRLSLYLKIDMACRSLRNSVGKITSVIASTDEGKVIFKAALDLDEPPEIAEAWDNLGIFPPRLFREIASIRENARKYKTQLSETNSTSLVARNDVGKSTPLGTLHQLAFDVGNSATAICDGLAAEVEKLAPDMRRPALSGEPIDHPNDHLISVRPSTI